MGTPTNAASSPSAVFWNGNLHIVAIPLTLATNSALGGTLKPFPDIRRVEVTLLWSQSKFPCLITLWEALALNIWDPPKTARVWLTILIEENMISLPWNQFSESISEKRNATPCLCKQPSSEIRFNEKVSSVTSSRDSNWTFAPGARGWTLVFHNHVLPYYSY